MVVLGLSGMVNSSHMVKSANPFTWQSTFHKFVAWYSCLYHIWRKEGCDNRCDMMDSYEYVEECENYETEGGNACVDEIRSQEVDDGKRL